MAIGDCFKKKPVPTPTAPRENNEGKPVVTPPPQPVDEIVLPTFVNIADKMKYPLAAKFIADPSANVSGSLKSPKYVIMHHTVSYDLNSTVDYFKSEGVAIHLLVGHDGTVIQMAKFDQRCGHAGESKWNGLSGMNSYSIGVEFVNLGPIFKSGSETYKDAYGKAYKKGVRKREGLGYTFWEPLTEAQEKAFIEICWYFVSVLKIPVDNILGHYEVSPGRKNDPYGAFSWGPMPETRAHLKKIFEGK